MCPLLWSPHVKSDYTGYTNMVGLRNSHDRKFPVGVSFGSRTFVCDNLAFSGDHAIKRKHTANVKRESDRRAP
jgi:hypothetical protein